MMNKIKVLDNYIKIMIEENNSKYLCLTNFVDYSLIFKTNKNYSITVFNILNVILGKVLVSIGTIDNYLDITTNEGSYVLIDYSNNVIE